MSALARIAVSTVPYLLAIVLAWRWVTDGIAQGASHLATGGWASLIGLLTVAMALPVPLAGALVALLLAAGLRLRAPATLAAEARQRMSLAAPAVYFVASWITWQLMWWLDRPLPTAHARYEAPYFWMLGVLGAAVALPIGALAANLVTGDVRSGGSG